MTNLSRGFSRPKGDLLAFRARVSGCISRQVLQGTSSLGNSVNSVPLSGPEMARRQGCLDTTGRVLDHATVAWLHLQLRGHQMVNGRIGLAVLHIIAGGDKVKMVLEIQLIF
jgi:hypothetical protein